MKNCITYSYWKWLLLSRHMTICTSVDEGEGYVLIHDKHKNKIFIYDLTHKRIARVNLQALTYALLSTLASKYVQIGELKQFYKSLPNKVKNKMWDYLT